MKTDSQNNVFFYILLIVALVVAYLLLQPYLGVVVFALVTVIIFKPAFDLYMRWLKGRQGISTLLTIVTIFVTVLIPIIIVINITIDQTAELLNDISSPVFGEDVNVSTYIDEANKFLAGIPYGQTYQLTEAKIVETIQGVVRPIGSFLASRAVALGSSSADWIARFIIFLSLLVAIFPAYPKLMQIFKDLSPLEDELDQKYLDRVTAMTKAMVKGVFVIAIAQGLVTGIFLWIGGVPFLFFWIVLAIFLSILPLGANVIAVPIGLVLLALGDIWQGIVVIAGSLLVVSNVDNVLRPRLVPKEAELNPALVLLSAFGGLQLFGFLGVIYGPVIMIFLITTVEIYLEHYRLVQDAEQTAERA